MKKVSIPNARIIKYKKILIVAEMIFTLLYMFLSMSYATLNIPDYIEKETGLYLAGVFLMTGLTRVFRILGERYKPPVPAKKKLDLISCAAFFICTLVLLLNIQVGWAHEFTCIVYLLSLLAVMVLSMIQDHRLPNILLKLMLSACIIGFTKDLWNPAWTWLGQVQVMILVSFTALLNIFMVVFSRVQADVLKDIIRETYSLEIMFGLILLVLSLSYWLCILEPNMTYADALWYCFAIVTTIGFGDITATTRIGRIISVVLGAYGIIVVALITSIIVAYYGEMKKSHFRKKKDPDKGDRQSL